MNLTDEEYIDAWNNSKNDEEFIAKVNGENTNFIKRGIGDTAVALTKGGVGLGEAAWGIGNILTGGGLGKQADVASEKFGLPTVAETFSKAQDTLTSKFSPETQEAMQNVAAVKGFIPSTKEYFKNPSAIAEGLVENAPGMIGMMGLGKMGAKVIGKEVLGRSALGKAVAEAGGAESVAGKALIEQNANRAITAAAGGEGAFSAGQNLTQSMETLGTDTMTPEQIALMAGSGLVTALVSRMSGGLAKRLKLTDVDALLQGVNTGAALTEGGRLKISSVLKALVGSAIQEGALEELPQSAQEKYMQNLAEGKSDPWEGVEEAAAGGLIIGAAMGLGGAGGAALRESIHNSDPIAKEINKTILELNEGLKSEGLDILNVTPAAEVGTKTAETAPVVEPTTKVRVKNGQYEVTDATGVRMVNPETIPDEATFNELRKQAQATAAWDAQNPVQKGVQNGQVQTETPLKGKVTSLGLFEQRTKEATSLTPEVAQTLRMKDLERLAVQSGDENSVAQKEIDRRMTGQTATQLIPVKVPKKLSDEEQKAQGRAFVDETVMMTPDQFHKWRAERDPKLIKQAREAEKKRISDAVEMANKGDLYNQETVSALDGPALRAIVKQSKNLTVVKMARKALSEQEATTGRSYHQKYPSGTAMGEVLNMIHKDGLAVNPVTGRLPDMDATTQRELRQALMKHGLAATVASRKGKLGIDDIADQLNNLGVEAPQHGGAWTYDDVTNLIVHGGGEMAVSAREENDWIQAQIEKEKLQAAQPKEEKSIDEINAEAKQNYINTLLDMEDAGEITPELKKELDDLLGVGGETLETSQKSKLPEVPYKQWEKVRLWDVVINHSGHEYKFTDIEGKYGNALNQCMAGMEKQLGVRVGSLGRDWNKIQYVAKPAKGALQEATKTRGEIETSIADNSTAFLDKYYKNVKPLTTEEKTFYMKEWIESGSQKARNKIINDNMGYVKAKAVKYSSYRKFNKEELVAAGTEGLFKALDMFVPSKGNQFSTYADKWIEERIQNYIRENWKEFEIGKDRSSRELLRSFKKAEEETFKELGAAKEGTSKNRLLREVAEKLKVGNEALAMMSAESVSLTEKKEDEYGEEGEIRSFKALSETLSAAENQESVMIKKQGIQMLQGDVVRALDKLDERERYIIENRILSESKVTLGALAMKYGLSAERVRQVEKKAIAKLSSALKSVYKEKYTEREITNEERRKAAASEAGLGGNLYHLSSIKEGYRRALEDQISVILRESYKFNEELVGRLREGTVVRNLMRKIGLDPTSVSPEKAHPLKSLPSMDEVREAYERIKSRLNTPVEVSSETLPVLEELFNDVIWDPTLKGKTAVTLDKIWDPYYSGGVKMKETIELTHSPFKDIAKVNEWLKDDLAYVESIKKMEEDGEITREQAIDKMAQFQPKSYQSFGVWRKPEGAEIEKYATRETKGGWRKSTEAEKSEQIYNLVSSKNFWGFTQAKAWQKSEKWAAKELPPLRRYIGLDEKALEDAYNRIKEFFETETSTFILEIDEKAYDSREYAEANELGRQNGYPVIPMKKNEYLNAFVNKKTKQIFVVCEGEALAHVGHELSHVGVEGVASNEEMRQYIDRDSNAFGSYWANLVATLGKKVTEEKALEEMIADIQAGRTENFGVNLYEAVTNPSKLEYIVSPNRAAVTEMTEAPLSYSGDDMAARMLVKEHNKIPMKFSAAVDEFQNVAKVNFPFREMLPVLDNLGVDVVYDTSNTSTYYDRKTDTIYIGSLEGRANPSELLTQALSMAGTEAIVSKGLTKTGQLSIPLKQDLLDLWKTLAPFRALKETTPEGKESWAEAKAVYDQIEKKGMAEFVKQGFNNKAFAAWLNSIPDFKPDKFAEFHADVERGNPTLWMRFKKAVLRLFSRVMKVERTKLDALADIMNRWLNISLAKEMSEFTAQEETKFALRYKNVNEYLKNRSYMQFGTKPVVYTEELMNSLPEKKRRPEFLGLKVRKFKAGIGANYIYEPVDMRSYVVNRRKKEYEEAVQSYIDRGLPVPRRITVSGNVQISTPQQAKEGKAESSTYVKGLYATKIPAGQMVPVYGKKKKVYNPETKTFENVTYNARARWVSVLKYEALKNKKIAAMTPQEQEKAVADIEMQRFGQGWELESIHIKNLNYKNIWQSAWGIKLGEEKTKMIAESKQIAAKRVASTIPAVEKKILTPNEILERDAGEIVFDRGAAWNVEETGPSTGEEPALLVVNRNTQEGVRTKNQEVMGALKQKFAQNVKLAKKYKTPLANLTYQLFEETAQKPKVKAKPTNLFYIKDKKGNTVGKIDMEPYGYINWEGENHHVMMIHRWEMDRSKDTRAALSKIFADHPDITMIAGPANDSDAQNQIVVHGGANLAYTDAGQMYYITRDMRYNKIIREQQAQQQVDFGMPVEKVAVKKGKAVQETRTDILKEGADRLRQRALYDIVLSQSKDLAEDLQKRGLIDEDLNIKEMPQEGLFDDDLLSTSIFNRMPIKLPRMFGPLTDIINKGIIPESETKKFIETAEQFPGMKNKEVRHLLSLPFYNAKFTNGKPNDWRRQWDIAVDRIDTRMEFEYGWLQEVDIFLNRVRYLKEAGHTKEQIKDLDRRIYRLLTLGDERRRDVVVNLEKDLAKKEKQPLLYGEEDLQPIRDKIKAIQDAQGYTRKELTEGVKDDDGEVIKLSDPEYVMYKAIRNVINSIFNAKFEELNNMALAQYKNQRWFKLLEASLGRTVDDKTLVKIAGGLKSATLKRSDKVDVKLKDIFRKLDINYNKENLEAVPIAGEQAILKRLQEELKTAEGENAKELKLEIAEAEKRLYGLTQKESENVLKRYEKIAVYSRKEVSELKDYLSAATGITDVAELDKVTKDMFKAYQLMKPQLRKISALRSELNQWIGYFPRVRQEGKWKFFVYERYTDPKSGAIKNEEVFMDFFDGDAQRAEVYNRAMKEFAKDGVLPEKYFTDYKPSDSSKEGTFEGMSDMALQSTIDLALSNMKVTGEYFDENGKSIDMKAQLFNAAYNALAEQIMSKGASKFNIHRKQKVGEKAIKGYQEENLDKVLIQYITANAGLISRQRSFYDAMEALRHLDDKTRFNELKNYITGMYRPDTIYDKLSKKGRTFAFIFYLGLVVKSAFVNSTQPYIVGVPLLANYMRSHGLQGYKANIIQGKASYDIGRHFATLVRKDPSKWGSLSGLTQDEINYLSSGIIRGKLAAQQIRYIKGVSSGWGKLKNDIFDFVAAPFGMVEIYNRMSSALAMFRVSKEYHETHRSKEEEQDAPIEKATVEADEFINKVHYAMGSHNRPAITQTGTPTGAALEAMYVFRTFTHNFLLGQWNLLRSAAKLASKEGRSDESIRAQATNDLITFIHTMAMLGLFGGLLGLPFFKELFDWSEKKLGYSPKLWLRDTLNGWGGETLETIGMTGLPSLLGANISGSLAIGVPFLNEDPLDSVFGVWGGLLEKGKRAAGAAIRGDVYRMTTNLTPEALRGPIVALTESDFGVPFGTRGVTTTATGGPVLDSQGKPLKYTKGEAIVKGLGFQPTGHSREREIEWSLKNQVNWANEQKRLLSERLKIDLIQKDPNAIKNLLKGVKDINVEIKSRGIPTTLASVSRIKKGIKTKIDKQDRRILKARSAYENVSAQ